MKSRLSGLGGTETARDPAWVFETASLMFEPGTVRLVIEVTGFSGSFSFMFVELANHSTKKGSPRTRLRLVPMELHAGRNGAQRCELTFTAHAHIAYQVSGHIHGDVPLKAEALSITSDRRSDRLRADGRSHRLDYPLFPMLQADVRATGRLFDLAKPDFEQLHSQAVTTEQLGHPAFSRLQAEIFNCNDGSDFEQWPEIFTLRVLETFSKARVSQATIGFDAIDGPLWRTLLARKHDVLVAERTYDPSVVVDLGDLRRRHLALAEVAPQDEGRFQHSLIGDALPPEYCRQFDFAWWITRVAADGQKILRGLLNVAESLDDGGVGVVIFPIHYQEHGTCTAISFKTDLPRILIDAISLGHKIVQVRLSAPISQKARSLTYFAIIVHSPASGQTQGPANDASS